MKSAYDRRMTPSELGEDRGGKGEVDEDKAVCVDRAQVVLVLGPDEDEVARIKSFDRAIDVMCSAPPLDPEDLREIVRVMRRAAVAAETDTREVKPFIGADQLAPTLSLQHINIA